MPYVKGYLKIVQRGGGGRPDQELPGVEGPVDPDYGIDEGAGIGGGPIIPEPPPGVWPPLTPEHPWLPLPPGTEHPGHPLPPTGEGEGGEGGEHPQPPIVLPPGSVWPPLPPGVHGKYLALVLIGGGGHGAMYRYVVIDADLHPDQGLPPHPDQGLPDNPEAAPKSRRGR